MYFDSRLQSWRVPWPHWPQPTPHPIPIITGINEYFSLYLWDLPGYSERNKEHTLKLPNKPTQSLIQALAFSTVIFRTVPSLSYKTIVFIELTIVKIKSFFSLCTTITKLGCFVFI